MRRLATLLISMLLCLGAAAQNASQAMSTQTETIGGTTYYIHTVQEKQSLWGLHNLYGVSVDDIVAANPGLDAANPVIKTGAKLRIPAGKKAAESAAPVPVPVSEAEEKAAAAPQNAEPPKQTWWEKIRENAKKKKESDNADAGSETPAADSISELKAIPEAAAAPEVETIPAVEAKDTIRLTLMLPFKAKSKPSVMAYNFYGGVLAALDELGQEGNTVKLTVYDTEDGYSKISDKILSYSDILMGPVATDDIKRMVARTPEGKFIISPLEQDASELTDSLRFIQAPLPWKDQLQQLTRWACEQVKGDDKLILLKETGNTEPKVSGAVVEQIKKLGMGCTVISCNTFDDLKTLFSKYASKDGTTHFILASEKESFVKRIIKVISSMADEEYVVATYCPSKIRTFNELSDQQLSTAGVRIISAYYIDRESTNVQTFEKRYKVLFGSAPSMFAYQGYDLARYFVKARMTFGREWVEHLPEFKQQGLQSDLEFVKASPEGGYVNQGARRTMYLRDGSVIWIREN
ncbi:MAG: LysM peptidoglycan-binding domain-containing protein [Bacteroidales bacterium]|nr:LysM peptidoglycan-binding domain-containing protein [Bacteroidales bacterium]